jgi:hypothetical protein
VVLQRLLAAPAAVATGRTAYAAGTAAASWRTRDCTYRGTRAWDDATGWQGMMQVSMHCLHVHMQGPSGCACGTQPPDGAAVAAASGAALLQEHDSPVACDAVLGVVHLATLQRTQQQSQAV